MTLRVIAASGSDSGAAADAASEVLGSGGTVVLPTDTVYGLAASVAVPGATAGVFALKGRGRDVPLAVLCADLAQATELADDLDSRLSALAGAFWPGPLTVVAPRREGVVAELGEPRATVGVRCPDHALVVALARRVGPIATTSANRHGAPTGTGALDAAESLLGSVDLVVDAGPCRSSASTVVELVRGGWALRREGPVGATALTEVLGPARR